MVCVDCGNKNIVSCNLVQFDVFPNQLSLRIKNKKLNTFYFFSLCYTKLQREDVRRVRPTFHFLLKSVSLLIFILYHHEALCSLIVQVKTFTEHSLNFQFGEGLKKCKKKNKPKTHHMTKILFVQMSKQLKSMVSFLCEVMNCVFGLASH